jgi:hypothetical protein
LSLTGINKEYPLEKQSVCTEEKKHMCRKRAGTGGEKTMAAIWLT